MTQHYSKTGFTTTWRKLALVGLLGLAASGAAQAQLYPAPAAARVRHDVTLPAPQHRVTALSYPNNRAVNVAGTYTDLGTSGTAITPANLDDASSDPQNIGFDFSFNGATYSQFVLNTNGYIKLGSTAPSNPAATNALINTADMNVIAPASGLDLTGATNQTANPTSYRVNVSGAAGSRVCTIQFKNLADKTAGTTLAQFATMQFQIKLYEANSTIEFVYGAWTSTGNTAVGRGFLVGLKGATNATEDMNMALKASSASAWTTTVFQNRVVQDGQSFFSSHFVRNTFLPDPGRTYRFQTVSPNDATVETIYSLGKLPIPFGTPHTIQAVVTNVGTNALTDVAVTATVSGANTFTSTKTLATLAVGASSTVSFDPFTPTATGTNTVAVAVANDDNNSNNSLSITQLVNNTTYAYARPGVPADGNVGFGTGGGILAVKYTTSATRTVTGVTVRLEETTSVGNRVYAVVASATGSIIARSADYVIATADLGKDKTFALNGDVTAGSFFVGLAQTANATTAYYPLGLQSQEDPTRLGAYFTLPLDGGTPRDIGAQNFGTFMIEAVTSNLVTCPPPTAITVTGITPTSAIVTFTAPANGTAYSIIYGPKGFNPASAGTTVAVTASPFTLTGLTSFTDYDVYVRANCGTTDQSALAGPVSFITACQPPIITAFPYAENFDGVAANIIPCGIKVLNVNNDSKTWRVASSFVDGPTTYQAASSAPNAMIYGFNGAAPADDWFFTPALFLRTGNKYQLTFKYRTFDPAYPEKLEVKLGNTDTPAGQTTTIWNNDNITDGAGYVTTGTGAVPAVMAITPTTTGNYYIGFHAYSDRDQFYLAVDDLSITSSVVLGTSSALQQAINLYPNPTAGKLAIEVRGANAKNGLQVEVTNMLGQRVHTATVRDNVTSQIDLSGLANGMYVVKVRNGNDYMVRNISVQK